MVFMLNALAGLTPAMHCFAHAIGKCGAQMTSAKLSPGEFRLALVC